MRWPYVQACVSDSVTSADLERWRKFIGELASVDAHISIMTHDDITIASMPGRESEVEEIVARYRESRS